jgi:hypothetical protein
VSAKDLRSHIDHAAQSVTSTTHELKLDYGRGVLRLDAPQVQGASGNLQAAGEISLKNVTIRTDLDLAHIVAVALDNQPLATSRKILLQVMSEEQNTGFATEPVDAGVKRITDIGRDPWQVKRLRGTVGFQRPDAAQLKVTPLDHNGRRQAAHGTAEQIALRPDTLYYLIEP